MSSRDEASRRYLNRLDGQRAAEHLENAGREVGLAGSGMGDIAHRELQHDWQRLDSRMERSSWLGHAEGGSAADFTQWDGIKRAASDALAEGEQRAMVVKSHLPDVSQVLPDPYPSSSTPNLQTGLQLHAGFTRQYLKYAERDALAAAQQAGMTAKYAYAVARRRLFEATGAGKPQVLRPLPFEPNPIKRLADSREEAHDYNVKHGLAVAAGVAADVAGVAADVALGFAYARYRQHRKMVQEQTAARM